MKNLFYILLLSFLSSCTSKSFEGQVTYKHTIEAGDIDKYGSNESIESFKKKLFGEDGYRIEKVYYKGNRFISEFSQDSLNYKKLYKPENKKLYVWEESSGVYVDQKTNFLSFPDEFVEFVSSEETKTIHNIQCRKMLLKTKTGETEIWYNENYLKINPEDYSAYKLDYLNLIYQKTGCLPFKITTADYTIEVVDFKSMKVSDEKFELPEFILKEENQ